MSEQQPSAASTPPPGATSGLAIASLILGIAAWLFLPFLGSLGAVITGHLARREIQNSMGSLSGTGLATAGLILGYAQLVLVGVAICTIVVLALLGPAVGSVFSNIIMDI